MKTNIYTLIYAMTLPLTAMGQSESHLDEAQGQQIWTMDQCMSYAVAHSNTIRGKQIEVNSAAWDQRAAVAEFFPSLSASTSGQYSWGRNIDPETNTYNNVTTFGSGFGIYASVTVFDGGRTINRWKQAKIAKQSAHNALQKQTDDKAIETMMAYIDAVYYQGAIAIAAEKLAISQATEHKTEVQETLGIKGPSDLATAKSQTATDEYQLIHNRNLYNQALLTLTATMNLPQEVTLIPDTTYLHIAPEVGNDNAAEIYTFAANNDPTACDARYNTDRQRLAYRISKGALYPTISLSAGISTSYYKMLNSDYEVASFGNQFKNNRGEYVYATLSIPLFSNLTNITNVKKSRNNLETAKLHQEETMRQLYNDIAQAVMDRDGYAMEIASLMRKTDADRIAYTLNSRKYEEGLLSLIDLQVSANTLYESRLNLLKTRMLYILKERLVNYYKGIPLL